MGIGDFRAPDPVAVKVKTVLLAMMLAASVEAIAGRDAAKLRAEGAAFRQKVISALVQAEKTDPRRYYDLHKLCDEERFAELSVPELEIKMQGAGQKGRVFIVSHPAGPGNIKAARIASGFGISESLIGGGSFNMIVAAEPLDVDTGRVTQVVSCGVRSIHL